MTELLTNFISTVLQIIVFALIPYIFYLFRKDKGETFFHYIGLYSSSGKSFFYVILASLIFITAGIGMIFIDANIRAVVISPPTVTGKLRQMGFNLNSIIILLLIALLKTSFSEEIFFRGFIARRLMSIFGFQTGNILQAIIFGLVHLLLFWFMTKAALVPLFCIFLFSTTAGWVIGFIKERYAAGSIMPGWIAHGVGNALSYGIIAFVI
ncbi:MAG: CPBP family intramembrane glutamic endopeptidase [Saprospiraceae bacterium]